MADYINRNILSQAYIHVEPELFMSDNDLANFEARIKSFAESRASFYLSPEASVKLEFEEGSLKYRVTIMGTILLLMQGIANYKDFSEGIQLIYNDTKRLSEYIISEGLFETKSKHQNIIRLEARAGIVGSIQKIINQLEHIKRGTEGSMPASNIISKINESRIAINSLSNNIIDDRDRAFVINGLFDIARELPASPRPPKNKTNSNEELALYRDERRKLIDLLSSNTNT